MKRSLFAALFMVSLCAVTTGSQAAPSASTTVEPASSTAPQFGGCRWYCGSQAFLTQSACQVVCSSACDEIC